MTAVSDIPAGAPGASEAGSPDELQVHLDSPLPEAVAVGAGTALFIAGHCFHRSRRVRELELVVDGVGEPVAAHGMPRLDIFAELHPTLDPYATSRIELDHRSVEDPRLLSYASGFWALARLLPGRGDCVIQLRAVLENGEQVTTPLARVRRVEPAAPAALSGPATASGPLVAVCMATFEPPLGLLHRQLESIRAQTHRNWVCVISDDCSRPERFARLERAVAGDERFVLSRSPRRLGFYRNFERALALAPREADHVALADQDDAWHPDKLEVLLGALGDARLVYSDARIVDRDGALISSTYWSTRANNHADPLSLLLANAVTGAASLFPRSLLDDALPFPPDQFDHYHDHWLALTALALGDIAFVERPLYDYVQHGGAVVGHAGSIRIGGLRGRLAALTGNPPPTTSEAPAPDARALVRRWRMRYFVQVCRLEHFATVLEMRVGDRMAPDKRRALRSFLAVDRSLPALVGFSLRGARDLVRRRTETLGAERMLLPSLLWRRALSTSARPRPQRRLRLDARPPPHLHPKPPRTPLAGAEGGDVAERIAPLDLGIRADAPPRVNLLIPTIDLKHFFGGYIAKLNLARRLSERGARVRLVTVDPVERLPWSWRAELEAYRGLEGVFDHVEVAFARELQGLEVSPSDRFIATTWWTAHLAADAVATLDGGRFLYLIQEYEPFTFPMGTFAALAEESYRFSHTALFSSELLRDYFRRHAIGVYAGGSQPGDERSAAFQNAITPVLAPTVEELAARRERRLLFYARPEPHAARNLFELGMMALSRAVALGVFDDGWELDGIGSVEDGRRLDLGRGASLNLVRRSGQADYADVLRGHDVGLALMHTPHPSLVPIEMASAGMLTVTSAFENKTPEAMAAISSNLITAEPTVDGVVGALGEAVAGVGDHPRRVAGSHVHWSSDWDRSFDDAQLDRVVALLEA